MRSSYRIATVFGIPIELHNTFVLFLLLILGLALFNAAGEDPIYAVVSAASNLAFILTLFIIVLFHEFSHSLVAKAFRIDVPKITLTPIGGMASIEVPEDPKKELLISLAGPLSNFALIALAMWLMILLNVPFPEGGLLRLLVGPVEGEGLADVFGIFIQVNFVLGAFNLLPAFPMDGGRVFRALLAFLFDYVRATELAVTTGRIIAALMIVAGFFANWFLIAIGAFLFFAGGQELQILKLKHAFRGLRLGDVAVRGYVFADANLSVREFISKVAVPHQTYYPVVDDTRRLLGIMNMEDLGAVSDPDNVKVVSFAVGGFESMDAGASVEENLLKLLTTEYVLVTEGSRIVGYTTPSDLARAASFQSIKGRRELLEPASPQEGEDKPQSEDGGQ